MQRGTQKDFGTWLRTQRRKSRLTQAELAQRIHCATVTLRKIEAGERHPSEQLAELLAEQLDIVPQSQVAFLEFAQTGSSSERILVQAEGWKQSSEATSLRNSPKPSMMQMATQLQSRAAFLIDMKHDQLLLDIHGKQRLPIASMTKIMTALIALEQAKLYQPVLVKQETLDLVKTDYGHSYLEAGDAIALKDMLYAMMLPSGNDAAFVIAQSIAGTVKEFVKLMNEYARRFRLKDTFYVNPAGIPSVNAIEDVSTSSYSTAADLVRLTQYALSNPLFAQIVQLQRYELPASPLHHAYTWESTNHLLSSYAGATGVKTGFSREAGACLVFSALSREQQLLGVVLQARKLHQRFTDAKSLLDWGFA
jgi:serine-type D-Ala-D-Ala carboxypeptidase (penicillin-binding protein 5/6)